MKKPIVTVPHEVLRKMSVEVIFDKKIKDFVKDLRDSLWLQDNPKGVGLSAPQLGKSWRIFATMLPPGEDDAPQKSDIRVFLNPSVLKRSSTLTLGDDPKDPILEGCLSIPGIYGPVPRPDQIEMEFDEVIDNELIHKVEAFDRFLARVIQHEYDHIDGILFTDYTLKYNLPLYEFRRKHMVEIDPAFAKAF
ncbi:peptide deformylase [Candidatus Cerribacteria bacterium 'Amazon FNV 2010 28 9']|uniref:Peptide deformylase n=1 Tax=Candidatus Cerribacteria bacterium 'Amazon FNV 2010 28 9' TaxID=2081795 RepID=A0A317JR51_9BACT|nr:MAG: peptide deformylase [Candidatus Cerribacteria bacterium 'Amazon FNV 2010 28 9']